MNLCLILNRYNNKTYKVDDIAWNLSPKYEFETKTGPITLIEYYKKVSSIRFKELNFC